MQASAQHVGVQGRACAHVCVHECVGVCACTGAHAQVQTRWAVHAYGCTHARVACVQPWLMQVWSCPGLLLPSVHTTVHSSGSSWQPSTDREYAQQSGKECQAARAALTLPQELQQLHTPAAQAKASKSEMRRGAKHTLQRQIQPLPAATCLRGTRLSSPWEECISHSTGSPWEECISHSTGNDTRTGIAFATPRKMLSAPVPLSCVTPRWMGNTYFSCTHTQSGSSTTRGNCWSCHASNMKWAAPPVTSSLATHQHNSAISSLTFQEVLDKINRTDFDGGEDWVFVPASRDSIPKKMEMENRQMENMYTPCTAALFCRQWSAAAMRQRKRAAKTHTALAASWAGALSTSSCFTAYAQRLCNHIQLGYTHKSKGSTHTSCAAAACCQ